MRAALVQREVADGSHRHRKMMQELRATDCFIQFPIPPPPPPPQLTNNWDGLRCLSGQVNKVNSKMMI